MTNYFLDASALVKRYAQEVGSEWVAEITGESAGHNILLAEISEVEVAAAFAAKERAARANDPRSRHRALARFLQDCNERFLVLQVDHRVIETAIPLTARHHLRGYDAVQLAAAVVANRSFVERGQASIVFMAADRNLLMAAQAEGLATSNALDSS